MTEEQERRTLEGLSAPVEADIQVRDATIRIEWFVEEGVWWCRLFNAALTFDDVGDVEDPPTEELRQEAIFRIAWNVADNLWPDEWTDPWPPCPTHRDHPLQPKLEHGRACWVCLRDHSVAVAIGALSSIDPGNR